jgi:type II secretory pathway component PulF
MCRVNINFFDSYHGDKWFGEESLLLAQMLYTTSKALSPAIETALDGAVGWIQPLYMALQTL